MSIIRVSGTPGSGKTTLCIQLAKGLNYYYSYTGGIFRELAKERGLSIEEFYKKIKADPDLEKEIDKRQAELMKINDNLVVEGRMAPFQKTQFPTINILVKVDPKEGAKRQKKRKENKKISQKEMEKISASRMREEKKRYQKLYGIEDYLDEKHFDIVIDTTKASEHEVVQIVLQKMCVLLMQNDSKEALAKLVKKQLEQGENL